MSKTIAVVNDNTGEIYAYLKGYVGAFPHNAWIEADEINKLYEFGASKEYSVYIIRWGSFSQIVDTRNYSLIKED